MEEKYQAFSKLVMPQFKTQSDYLAEQIKRLITSNEFDDGFVFPNENEFCKMLNVSRGTLRDAYKKLDTQGFIQRTKQGTFVKPREEIARQGNFSASLELASQDEMAEFICAFEPEAVCLATEKMTEDDLAKAEQLLLECESCAGDHNALNEANYRFHEFIRMKSGNNLIISALSAYYDIFSTNIINMIYSLLKCDAEDFKNQALRQHRQLFEAIKAKDCETARLIAREHLQADIREYARIKKA